MAKVEKLDRQRGQRIKHIRDTILDITQQELADLLKVKRAAVTNWERGKGITVEHLTRIAEMAGIPFNEISVGTGPKTAALRLSLLAAESPPSVQISVPARLGAKFHGLEPDDRLYMVACWEALVDTTAKGWRVTRGEN